jgi:glutaminyl-tRNA synthetase
MKNGEFPDGSKTLRAKIDMTSPNLNMRDPVMYRILNMPHHRTGDAWCIYPMYDFAHGQSDSLEGVTHSICTLEFADHRPLYDWLVQELEIFAPQQIEFARLNLSYTVMSKRKLLQLVTEKQVSGWDDPRMPTLVGMRRRGYPAAAIRTFCERIGVGKADSRIDLSVLEDCVREQLNESAPRRQAVLDPLKVVITNLPEEEIICTAANHPQKPELGERSLPLTREIYIEQSDFMEDPPKKFFRLGPGREVRLRNACIIRCDEVVKNAAGEVVELICSCDPETFGANPKDGRKVKGTIHWVSVTGGHKVPVQVYDRLFMDENPDKLEDFHIGLNPDSLVEKSVWIEPSLAKAAVGETFQFERVGYFTVDRLDPESGGPVFSRTVTLRDTWAKIGKS